VDDADGGGLAELAAPPLAVHAARTTLAAPMIRKIRNIGRCYSRSPFRGLEGAL
jgi:hypothetical protein